MAQARQKQMTEGATYPSSYSWKGYSEASATCLHLAMTAGPVGLFFILLTYLGDLVHFQRDFSVSARLSMKVINSITFLRGLTR